MDPDEQAALASTSLLKPRTKQNRGKTRPWSVSMWDFSLTLTKPVPVSSPADLWGQRGIKVASSPVLHLMQMSHEKVIREEQKGTFLRPSWHSYFIFFNRKKCICCCITYLTLLMQERQQYPDRQTVISFHM